MPLPLLFLEGASAEMVGLEDGNGEGGFGEEVLAKINGGARDGYIG